MRSNDNGQFTAEALRLIDDARRESIRMHHEYIGTEHVVLALARTDAEHTVSPLAEFGVDPTRVSLLLENTIRGGRDPVPADLQRPFTSRTKQAFAFAEEAARALGHARVDVSHVLFGIMRERKGIGAQVLADQGLSAELVDAKIRRAPE